MAAAQPVEDTPEDDAAPQVGLEELSTTPPPVLPSIQAPRLASVPAEGAGRMRLSFDGNRRWCTHPDDRVMAPPDGLKTTGAKQARGSIFTFGYQFTVAAVERSRPDEVLMLFESPVYRTAVYRQAAKAGKASPKPKAGPVIVETKEQVQRNLSHVDPGAIVPVWQEQYRCTTLPEFMDFDLRPGTYDVYMAFDILLRSGNWTHRTVGFGTDIAVEAGRATHVDARANIGAGSQRELAILGSEFADPAAAAEQP
jgi:hypothetical protein